MLETLVLSQTANLIFDPVVASDDQNKIIFVNLAYLNLTGWTEEEVLKKDRNLFYTFPESPRFQDGSNTLLQEGTLFRKDGDKLFLKGTSSLLFHPSVPNLKLGQLIVFHTNISNSIEDYSADDFVSTVSHELRTPLTSIKGFAETLLRSAQKIDLKRQAHFLHIIKERSEHLARLVEDLLLVSRLHNNRVHLIVRELSIKKYIEKVCKSLENQLETKKFSYQFPPEEVFVMGDSDRLEQILINLISNAIKYSTENTEITVSIEPGANPDTLKISIKNQGEPIPEKNQKSIFDRFSRIDNPLTRKISGTGLGLYISKSLVSAMNGELLLEKSDQESTVFSFSLPQREQL